MRTSIIIFLFHFVSFTAFCQAKQISIVLKKNIQDKDFHFKGKGEGKVTYIIRYLGRTSTLKGQVIKFVNLSIVSVPVGLTTHYNGFLVLYNDADKFLGSYPIGSPISLPDHLDGTDLVFAGEEGCTATTRISFKKTIMKDIYIRCNKDGGDIYRFSTENIF